MTTPRVYLGRDQNMAGMVRVYLLPDALEVDETTFIEIERTRVYFDDVLAITYHRAYNWVLLAILGGFGTLFALIGATVLANDQPGGAAAQPKPPPPAEPELPPGPPPPLPGVEPLPPAGPLL